MHHFLDFAWVKRTLSSEVEDLKTLQMGRSNARHPLSFGASRTFKPKVIRGQLTRTWQHLPTLPS